MTRMLSFSPEKYLRRAPELAKQQGHYLATPVHLLLSLTDDDDALAMMKACSVDIARLRWHIEEFIRTELPKAEPGDDADSRPTAEFQTIIKQAVLQKQMSGREEVTGADVLLVLLLEREAARFLQVQGMTRYDALRYISHGIAKAGLERLVFSRTEAERYSVQLLNDDYTPMEFVVHVLESVFDKTSEDAMAIMLDIHYEGIGFCGVYTFELAETKATEVMNMAKKSAHPLQCTMEPA